MKHSKPIVKVAGLELYVMLNGEYTVNAPPLLMMGLSDSALTPWNAIVEKTNETKVKAITVAWNFMSVFPILLETI
jgi:hypothetical protein